ncbi:MAG: ankyrin repeat domain-containing protein [Betaproteobacteria bacterium]|nr:ankyrin repeat domain-containing protein [Betaproteobacteria bacterium]
MKFILSFIVAIVLAASPFAAAHQGGISNDDWEAAQKYHAEYVAPVPLFHASMHGETAEIKRLLDGGVDPNLQVDDGPAALMYAAGSGYLETVRILLDNGANPDMQLDGGTTALIYAAGNGYLETVRILLDNGANPNLQVDGGTTALMFAAIYKKTKTVRALLDGGANPNLENNGGETALNMAGQCGYDWETAEALIDGGSDDGWGTYAVDCVDTLMEGMIWSTLRDWNRR